MAILLGMVAALVGGMSITAILAGLTLPDWIALAGLLLSAGEEAIKIFVKLHPALAVLEAELTAKSKAWFDADVVLTHDELEQIAKHAMTLFAPGAAFTPSSTDPSQLPYVPEN